MSYGQVEDWLDQEVATFFDTDGTIRTIRLGKWIKYIRRMAEPGLVRPEQPFAATLPG